MNILVLQRPDVLPAQRSLIEEHLASLGDVSLNFATSASEARRFRDTEILICPTLPYLDEVLQGLPRLRWIHFLSAGVDPIWAMSFDKSRYAMSKSIGVHAATITEYVIAAILHVLKGFGTFQRQQERHSWRRFQLEECEGKTLGIIGIGTIGARLAKVAKGFGMTVLGTVTQPRTIPYVDHVYASQDASRVLAGSDFVVLLAPLTKETCGLMDDAAFTAMKKSAWLINVARGELVCESSLIQALRNKVIAGAVLDVFEEEPLPEASPLWAMDNVLITPHVAGTTQHYMKRALDVFKNNYGAFTTMGKLVTPVSIEKGY